MEATELMQRMLYMSKGDVGGDGEENKGLQRRKR